MLICIAKYYIDAHGASKGMSEHNSVPLNQRETEDFRPLETQSCGKPAPLFIRSHSECTCMCAKSPQSCSTLRDTMDCSPPDSSVHGILQARILKWVPMPSSRRSSQPRGRTQLSCFAGRFFTAEPPGKTRSHNSAPQKPGKRLSFTDILH